MRPLIGPLLTSALALSLYVFMLANPGFDLRLVTPTGHFWIVSLVALIALGVAVVIGEAGRRLRNGQVLFLSLAFVSLAGFFLLHGLSTPGFLQPFFRLPSIAAQLSHTFLAFWLCVATLPPLRSWPRWLQVRTTWILPGWTALVIAFVVVGLARPGIVGFIAVDQAPLQWAVMSVTFLFLGVAGWRFLDSYRFTRLPLQKSMLYAVGWIAVSQYIAVVGTVWQLSWWLYHLLLLAAMVLLAVGLWQQYAAGGIRASLHALFAQDPEERIRLGLSPSVRALVVATEAKDRYTAGHNERVARHAVRIGRALALRPERLRALAQGGMVHDVGKIEIPDAVLNKKGTLTDEEFALIRRHPVVGFQMAERLGMMREELDVIRHHHERWDGAGYPDGLAGEQIPLLARVLAVADVYDALTSDRAYRTAWDPDRANAYLRDQAGKAFDPSCVEAWLAAQEAVRATPQAVASLKGA